MHRLQLILAPHLIVTLYWESNGSRCGMRDRKVEREREKERARDDL